MEQPNLEFAFELKIKVAAALEMGVIPQGNRRIIPITGGSFEGPAIKGTVVPGGYDWQIIRNDGVADIDARYVLITNDGVLITIINKGLRHGPKEVMQKLAKGEVVDPALYYFRSVPSFETSEARYDWLTKSIFLATGIREPELVIIRVWKVL
jgi:hypothetical protein